VKQVSDRRNERLSRIGARGPLQAEARRLPCANCKRGSSDPCHLEPVGRGFGDWKRIGWRWVGRVAPLCRWCHQTLHGLGNVEVPVRRALLRVATTAAYQLGERWAAELGINLWAEGHPYTQWQTLGCPNPGDL